MITGCWGINNENIFVNAFIRYKLFTSMSLGFIVSIISTIHSVCVTFVKFDVIEQKVRIRAFSHEMVKMHQRKNLP